jgi:hypothetical protein
MLSRTIRPMDVMKHSSSFLLPKLNQPTNAPAMNYALVVLNQNLPRFMPRLWGHGNHLKLICHLFILFKTSILKSLLLNLF